MRSKKQTNNTKEEPELGQVRGQNGTKAFGAPESCEPRIASEGGLVPLSTPGLLRYLIEKK